MKQGAINIIKQIIVGEIETNCYLFISNNELVIIDPGDEAEKILKEIKKIKAKPKYIINTHYHFDHVLANKKIKEETGVQILIHEDEKNFIDFDVDRFLKEGSKINIGDSILRVIHTPGHTEGGICLLGEDLIFTGDTLFKDGYGRTDLSGGSQKDLIESLKMLSELLKPGMMVYPGHGEIFKI